uniref:Uncharacterized protein n=1 Tax=Graphocephala atropunctata TaxID=36148 RepID=A0A1B6KT31_9HEMI
MADQGPPSRGCPCPGGTVGPTPQETPGHRMNRPPSPAQFFLFPSNTSAGSCPDSYEEPTPYNTAGHRMNRPPSPANVFTFDVAPPDCGYESSIADSSFSGSCSTDASSASEYYAAESSFADTSGTASSVGSSYYTPQCSPPGRGYGAPVAESSPTATCPRSYSPGLSPVSPISPGLNASFDMGRGNATFDTGCPNTTFDMGRGNATFDTGCPNGTVNLGRANETYVWTWEDSNDEGIFEDISLEDDVFEPPESPTEKRRPPPIVIREELNETFTMRVPGQGFMDVDPQTDCPQNATFDMDCPGNATFNTSCPGNATFDTGCPNGTVNLGRANETYVWTWEDSNDEGIFEDISLEDDVFEPPESPTEKRRPPPIVGGVIDEALLGRIVESQERVRVIVEKVKKIVATRECQREDPNRTF